MQALGLNTAQATAFIQAGVRTSELQVASKVVPNWMDLPAAAVKQIAASSDQPPF
jgi:hypothetical protein